jgi:hypothetical protein
VYIENMTALMKALDPVSSTQRIVVKFMVGLCWGSSHHKEFEATEADMPEKITCYELRSIVEESILGLLAVEFTSAEPAYVDLERWNITVKLKQGSDDSLKLLTPVDDWLYVLTALDIGVKGFRAAVRSYTVVVKVSMKQ